MTVNQRIARNLALAVGIAAWLAVIVARAADLVFWSWIWVLSPYWVAVSGLVVFMGGTTFLTLLTRWWLWLVVRADRRRREREVREIRRAMDDGLHDLVKPRATPPGGEASTRRPRP